jgi:hypothetical protein
MKIPVVPEIKSKWLVATMAALLGLSSHAADITYEGMAKVERFDNVTGGLNGLITNPKYTGNQPDNIKFLSSGLFYDLEGALDGFGARITGWITPTEDADYVFFVAADDSAAFYLSTDSTAANLKLIAADVGWQNTREWTGPGGNDPAQTPPYRRGIRATGEPPYENRSDQFLQSPQNAALDTTAPRWPTLDDQGRPIISLAAGQKYFFRLNFVEGSGGAHAEVAWKKSTDEDPLNGSNAEIPASFLSVEYTDTLSFKVQPQDVTTFEGQVVNFTSEAIGFPGGVTYQWFENDQPIPDAINPTYQIPSVTELIHNGNLYKVVVTSVADPSKTATSRTATLLVSADNVGPRIAQVRSSENKRIVRVVYNESVNDAAIDIANYEFTPLLTVEDANFDVDIVAEFNEPRNPGDNPKVVTDPRKRVAVLLTVSGMLDATNYELTVNNVDDLAGNALNPTTKTMTSPVFTPSVLNYKRWHNGNNVGNLRNDAYRFSNPSVQGTLNIAETAFLNAGITYVDRVSGFFVPPSDGEYIFYVSADNDGFLYLSEDSDPANLKLIAADVGWQNARVWTGAGGDTVKRRGDTAGGGPFENRSDEFLTSTRASTGAGLPAGDPRWATVDQDGNAVINLIGGNRYYFELYHQEGDGGRVEATYKLASEADPVNGTASRLTGNVVGAMVDPSSFLPVITAHPTLVNFTAGGTISFSVTATSAQPLTYQWFKDGVALTGQTNATLTINNATDNDMGSYHVAVSNENGAVNSNQALALTAVTAPGLTFRQDATGAVVIEAEHYFAARSAADGHLWVPLKARAGASGTNYMQILPDSGINVGNNPGFENGAQLDFKIEFNRAGTHYLWVRGGDPVAGGAGDSVHAGINGQTTPTATQISGAPTFNVTGWNWVGNINGDTRTQIEVPSAGTHTVNFWMREDGFLMDKIILTTDAAFTPTGTGPAESEQSGGDRPTLSISRNGATVTITYTGTLVSSPTLSGTYNAVTGASGGSYVIPAGATTQFYKAQR